MSDAQVLLRHIAHCISRIAQDTKNGKEVFMTNETLQDAVVHNLQIIGEASKKLPDHLQSGCSAIPWKEIAGMRDVIVHDYFGISWEIVWDVIQNRLPTLKKAINDMLNA